MKNYKIKFLLLGLVAFISSCEADLEDVKPRQELEETYFSSELRIQQAVGAAYAKLADIYGAQLNAASPQGAILLPADDVTFDGEGNSFENFSGLTAGSGLVNHYWKRYYELLARTNFVLEKIEEPEVSKLYETADLKDWNEGEMKFLRAWCHIKLWDMFRKAPVMDSRIGSPEDAYLPPSQDFEALDFAIADLEEATALLPVDWDNSNKGRVFKDSAYGLLVKAYVMRANYSKDLQYYTKAIAAYSKITTRSLMPQFGDNFDYRTENNMESLFEYQASFNATQENAWLNNDFGGGVGQMGAYYHYFTAHWGNYSSGIFGPTQKIIGAFDSNDPRAEETFSSNPDNLNWSLWFIDPNWTRFNGYHYVKYVKAERGNNYDDTWLLGSANNPRLLRYADVKLLVAEAYLQIGDQANALMQVNDIRERARFSTPNGTEAAAPLALPSVTMQNIMDERYRELAA
nr:RagB/SusD family nutrient uptake outer membrane protein [Tamlana sp. I1]